MSESEIEDHVETKLACDILIEFLEAAIHNIIYSRQIYPASIFARKKKYGTPLMVSIHPQLNAYIRDCLKCAHELLKKKELRNISVILQDTNLKPLESFVFDVIELHSTIEVNDQYLIKCEEALRACCLKLNVSHTYLKPLPSGSTFQIQILTTETALTSISEDPMLKDFPWIETKSSSSKTKNYKIVPVKSLDTDFLKIQVYIEENSEKQEESETNTRLT